MVDLNASPARGKTKGGHSVKMMEIQPHGKEGFSVIHHHEQSTKGEYKEPTTHIMKHHGELMDHVHDHMKQHGSQKEEDGDCPMCAGDDEGSKEPKVEKR
jgi:hypothetical protein